MENFLEHFGVKGMKWGIRRKSGSGRGKGGTKPGKSLTTTELKKRVDRLSMEKRYSELSKESKRESLSTGKRIVDDIVTTFANEYPKQFGRKAGKRGAGITVGVIGDAIEKKVKG